MAQEHGLGLVSSPCGRHRWAFRFWMHDPLTCAATHTVLRYRVYSCKACGLARITPSRNGIRAGRVTYAESLNEAFLGAKLSEFENELIQARLGEN